MQTPISATAAVLFPCLDVVPQVIPQVEQSLQVADGDGLEIRLPVGELRAVGVEQAELGGAIRGIRSDDEIKVRGHNNPCPRKYDNSILDSERQANDSANGLARRTASRRGPYLAGGSHRGAGWLEPDRHPQRFRPKWACQAVALEMLSQRGPAYAEQRETGGRSAEV